MKGEKRLRSWKAYRAMRLNEMPVWAYDSKPYSWWEAICIGRRPSPPPPVRRGRPPTS